MECLNYPCMLVNAGAAVWQASSLLVRFVLCPVPLCRRMAGRGGISKCLEALRGFFKAFQNRSFFLLPTVTARAQRPRTDKAVRVKKTGVLSPVSGGGQFERRVLQL